MISALFVIYIVICLYIYYREFLRSHRRATQKVYLQSVDKNEAIVNGFSMLIDPETRKVSSMRPSTVDFSDNKVTSLIFDKIVHRASSGGGFIIFKWDAFGRIESFAGHAKKNDDGLIRVACQVRVK